MIGKLQRVPLREVWKYEALEFTPWLQENIDVLNDVLDLSLSNPESEQSAGDFNVDLVAEDEAGNPVIIENQLEKSDHDHLGKLITYLTAIEAKQVVGRLYDKIRIVSASIERIREELASLPAPKALWGSVLC